MAVVLLVSPCATAALIALALRLESLVSTLLIAYLGVVVSTVGTVLVLSPGRDMHSWPMLAVQVVILAASLGVWLLRGRPTPSLAPARATARAILTSPALATFAGAVALLLAYELFLGLTVAPNNWDSLTYHLARVTAWAQHGGYGWITNAPDDRLNEFQPGAEQELLYLFVATRSDVLYAIPQLVAELALLLSIYGISRRLGHTPGEAVAAALVFATLTLVALESTTAQNDLVAASFPAVATALLLGSARSEWASAGVAASLGIGVKLTTALAWPVIVGVALVRRNHLRLVALGAVVGFVALASWGFILNLEHTGQLLGHGGGRVEHSTSPGFPRSLITGLSILYMTMDLSALHPPEIVALTLAGVAVAAIPAFRRLRSPVARDVAREAARRATPYFLPAAVIVVAFALAELTRWLGGPVKGPNGTVSQESGFFGGLNNVSDESQSFFGPLGAAVLVAVPVVTLIGWLRRRTDRVPLLLALSYPCFLVALALESEFNLWLGRFMVVPAALMTPLLARQLGRAPVLLGYAVLGTLTVWLSIAHDSTKNLMAPGPSPWHLSRAAAVAATGMGGAADGTRALDAAVSRTACIGASLGIEDPVYLIDGGVFQRRVVFLPPADPVAAATRLGLRDVVITRSEARTASDLAAPARFRQAGWKLRPLAAFWWLATPPGDRTTVPPVGCN